MTKLGAPLTQLGYMYLNYAVVSVIKMREKTIQPKIIQLKNLIADIANEFGSTERCVECALRYYVNIWWKNGKLNEHFEKKPTTKRLIIKLFELSILEKVVATQ
jgi:hypothetical protein